MQVLDILYLMGTLSLGNDNITAQERAIFLQYLNLAHFELYQSTVNLNQDLLIFESAINLDEEEDIVSILLDRPPYLVSSVYDTTNQNALIQTSLADVILDDPSFSATGNPTGYYVHQGFLNLIPIQTQAVRVSVWYVPQPELLTEYTLEENIPYPLAYHPVLVDGALYYLFQEEGGFKNAQKADAAQNRWEIGKSRLLSYLYNSSGQTFSTFSNV